MIVFYANSPAGRRLAAEAEAAAVAEEARLAAVMGRRRWPAGPLLERFGADELAAAGGVTRAAVRRWRERGIGGDARADALAVALGLHPAEVWPEWASVEAG